MKTCTVLAGAMGLALTAGPVLAVTELIANGGFETGTFAGWTVVDEPGGLGSFFVTGAAISPVSIFPTAGPAAGAFYAVSDQTGGGTHVLLQSFTVPGPASSVILSFDMFANDQSGLGPIVNPAGLTFLAGPNQHARVDILTAAALPFDTGAGVLANFYLGNDLGSPPNPYSPYVFDITGLVGTGGTFQLRFAEVDNQLWFQQGVDNVSILFEEAVEAVPEPVTASLGALSLAALGLSLTRRRTA